MIVSLAILLAGFAWNVSAAASGPEQAGGTAAVGREHGAATVADVREMGAAKAAGDIAQPLDCRGLLEAIEQQKALLLRETGQLKREIAALRQEMTNPGIKDVLAGFGYIFGITGLALYFHCRKSKGA